MKSPTKLLVAALSGCMVWMGAASAQKGGAKPAPAATAKVAPPAPAAKPAAPTAPPAFSQAVDYFVQQEKAGAWSKDTCKTSARKFQDAASKHKLVDGYFNAGASFAKCGMWEDAKEMYDKALSMNPEHGPSLGGLGEIALRQGREADAQRYFLRAVDLKNNTSGQVTGARNNLAAIAYRKMRQTSDPGQRKKLEEESFGYLQRTLALDGDNVFAYTLMALIYMEGSDRNKSRLNLAQILVDQGKKRNDRYAPLWNASGLLKMKRGAVSSAQKDFRQAIQLDPRFVEPRMNLGQIVLSARNYAEAETQFREVLKIQAKSYDATIGLGVALRGNATVLRAQGAVPESAKKIDEAEQTYQAAMAINNKRGDAYYNLGLLYKDYRTNDTDLKKQIEAYRKAKNFFTDYLARAEGSDPKRKEAEGHVSDCDKTIAALNQAIQIQGSSPPPAPQAGGGTSSGTP